jgi:Tol biopolymer transport system component
MYEWTPRFQWRAIVIAPALFVVSLMGADGAAGQAPPASSNPTVSPDGRLIAFVSNRTGSPDIYVVAAEDGPVRQLTHSPEDEGRPMWSPDGRAVRYTVTNGNKTRVYAVAVETADVEEIGIVNGRGGSVSPDRRRVVYMSGDWAASRLAVANLDGTDERLLTTSEQTQVAWNPQFSPDGAWVAFTGQDTNRQLHVFVVNVKGEGLRQLTHFSAEEGRAQVPAWSADGQQIAFQLSRKGVSELWRVPFAGGDPVPILKSGTAILEEVPTWFPDGRQLAFQSTRSGRMEVWTVHVDGSGLRQLTGADRQR